MRPTLIEIPTDDGPTYVNPREVKIVKPRTFAHAPHLTGSVIYLKGNGPQGSESIYTDLTPRKAAKIINGES